MSFEVKRGEIRSLLGPNGAGKTTAFNILAGVEAPSRGKVFLDGKDVTSLPIHSRAKLGLSYLPQAPSLFLGLKVLDNLLLILENLETKTSNPRKTARDYLERLDLGKYHNQSVNELSAGQKRKAEIARALVTSPTFLLLDEPFSELDPKSVDELSETLERLKEEDDLGLALTDHKVRETLRITDYNYLIQSGKIFVEGVSEAILEEPSAREEYLGHRLSSDQLG